MRKNSDVQELVEYFIDAFWLVWDEPWFRRLENSYTVVKNGEFIGCLRQRQILIKGLVALNMWERQKHYIRV